MNTGSQYTIILTNSMSTKRLDDKIMILYQFSGCPLLPTWSLLTGFKNDDGIIKYTY